MSDISAQIDAASKKIDLFGQTANRRLARGLTLGMLRITADAKRFAPKDTGHLAQSITQTPVETEGDKLVVIGGPTVEYGPHVEFGTSPHSSSDGSEDFVTSITRWGQRKGMDASQINALIEHIRKNGTKPHPYMGPAFYQNLAAVEQIIHEEMNKE